MTWDKASEYGHKDTVYTTPDYLPYPVRGSKFFTSALGDTYRKEQPCSDGPSSLTLQYVIGKEGKIVGLHPRSKLNSFCEQLILQTFERIEFVPGEHNDKPVNVLMAITIVTRRN
ncbi:hypothetical protein [Gracilimonas sediminicola]|uniref:TonB protein C-terminal n=1 Tax=Gracilimonas sediminicola TaxID=2952158 RepID=A0A9X2L2X6_9BACT|nr:hypothetical protein [Gracilimonas sediminicola]MCP9291323.1 hypothetical protein [Gracilimonas sediminicola]